MCRKQKFHGTFDNNSECSDQIPYEENKGKDSDGFSVFFTYIFVKDRFVLPVFVAGILAIFQACQSSTDFMLKVW
jgi:hypothetical protein